MRSIAGRFASILTVFALAFPAFPSEQAEILWSLTSFGTSDYFHEPSDIEVDPERSLIYVVDAGSNRVLVFGVDGGFVRTMGSKGQGPGEFQRATGACLVPGGGLAVADFPETHPFVRAIKHRVSLALSPQGKLYLPYFAVNLIQVFERTGRKVGEFTRPLPFKPVTPALVGQKSPEEGVVQMRADLDFVSLAAQFGPDGKLYILTVADALAAIRKKNPKLEDPLPMRIDVVDPETFQGDRTIACDAGIKAFAVMDGGRLVYVYEDAEGELALKCVRY